MLYNLRYVMLKNIHCFIVLYWTDYITTIDVLLDTDLFKLFKNYPNVAGSFFHLYIFHFFLKNLG